MEDALLEKLKAGDRDSFIFFVNKYKEKVISLCYYYTKDYLEAEDISQETFISFYKSIENFRGESALSTYLFRIAINKCLTYKKKKSIKNFLSGLLNLQKSIEQDFEEKSYVRECIDSLPQDLKTPIILYYYIGLNYKEIGRVLKISERAVEGRLYRAKQKLKSMMEKEEGLLWKDGIL